MQIYFIVNNDIILEYYFIALLTVNNYQVIEYKGCYCYCAGHCVSLSNRQVLKRPTTFWVLCRPI